jgi:hypothetical protein
MPSHRVLTGLVLFALACSGPRNRPPGAAPLTNPSVPVGSGTTTDTAPKAPTTGGIDALTRQKFSDEEYMAAIADLEKAGGTVDAARDRAEGRKQVLGFQVSGGGWAKFPGLDVSRENLPPDFHVLKIAGIMQGTDNRHALRFEMLATKYAKDYNETMLRGGAQ